MNEDQLICMIEAADCMLSKTNISEEYRSRIESAKAGAVQELHKLRVKNFIVFLDQLTASEQSMAYAEEQQFKFMFDGHVLGIPFNPTVYDGLLDLLKDYYDEI
jgi:predicted AAA+ superfamily ATPase